MTFCVIVVDMQRAVIDADPAPFEAQAVVARINRLTALAREARVPVIFFQHEHPSFLAYGSEAWRLCAGIHVVDGDLHMRKTSGDAFLNTDLHTRLQAMKVETLVIGGYASEFCIDTTTRRAVGLGYRVQLIADAHTTCDKPHLSAAKIREHHTVTLSQSPSVMVSMHDEIAF